MSIQRITASGMVSLTAPLVKPGTDERNALAAVPELAVLLPHVDTAHQLVLEAQGLSVADREEPLTFALTRVDGTHDEFWRGIYYSITAHIHLCRARGLYERTDQLAALLATMMPSGLDVVKLSYREESGAIELLNTRLTGEERALLASVPVEGGTLGDVLVELTRTAEELGQLEDARSEVRQSAGEATMNQARAAWIRAVGMLRNMADMLRISDPEIVGIMRRFDEACIAAERRARRGDTETPATEPQTEPGDPTNASDGPDTSGSTEPLEPEAPAAETPSPARTGDNASS